MGLVDFDAAFIYRSLGEGGCTPALKDSQIQVANFAAVLYSWGIMKEKGTWGGKRAGAGRPQTSPFVSHISRPLVEKRRIPVRITLRLRSGLPSMRSAPIYEAFEKAALRARRFGLRIVEYSLLPNAIHMICEFHDREQLERSFKSLNTTLAIALKRAVFEKTEVEHKGPIFLGRYKMELLDSPERVKAAIKDVLTLPSQKQKKHFIELDPYSSAPLFTRWKKLLEAGDPPLREPASPDELEKSRARAIAITASPQFWLSHTGWLKG